MIFSYSALHPPKVNNWLEDEQVIVVGACWHPKFWVQFCARAQMKVVRAHPIVLRAPKEMQRNNSIVRASDRGFVKKCAKSKGIQGNIGYEFFQLRWKPRRCLPEERKESPRYL
jgi:hypothetical protein